MTDKKLTRTQKTKLDKLPTTSARIRYLDQLGWSRSAIAKQLGKRYQHVRNVLITPVTNQKV